MPFHTSHIRIWLIISLLAVLLFAAVSFFATCSAHPRTLVANTRRHQAVRFAKPSFVVAITTVARHGNGSSYLPRTLESLVCALETSQPRPPVLVVNGDVPASRHAAFTALQQGSHVDGVRFLTRQEMHPELHKSEFVASECKPSSCGPLCVVSVGDH
jgi:hypothetical protein